MNELHPHAVGPLTYTTERALLREYASILTTAVVANYQVNEARPEVTMDAADIEDVLGKKYGYMTMRRCKFTLSGDEWVRPGHFGGGAVEIYADDVASACHVARRALDPLGLCKAFRA